MLGTAITWGCLSRALAGYVAKHKASQLTQRLNLVYAGEVSRLDAAVVNAQVQTLPRESW